VANKFDEARWTDLFGQGFDANKKITGESKNFGLLFSAVKILIMG
jgi:hypothetical protein